MSLHKHTPEQMKRINAFLKKASKENRLPESYYAHLMCEIELRGYEIYGNIQAEFASINPIVQLNYLLSRKVPDVKPSKSMRQCVSNALLEIAKTGDVKYAKGLIHDLKADPNYLNSDGETPLYHAIRRKRLGMAEMLLQHGADMYLRGGDSLDPLNLACAMGFPQGISLLIKHGGDLNHPTPFKSWRKFHLGYQTFYAYPLAVAVCQNQPESCKTLLEKGANLDLKIRPDLTIRDFMKASLKDMPPKMQMVVNRALSGEKNEVLIPEVLPPEPKVVPHTNIASIHIDTITIDVHTDLPPKKVATKSQPNLNPDIARIHD